MRDNDPEEITDNVRDVLFTLSAHALEEMKVPFFYEIENVLFVVILLQGSLTWP